MKVPIKKTQKIKVKGSFYIYPIMREILFRETKLRRKQEYFWVIGLNTTNRIEYIELVALGQVNRLTAKPMDILSLALQKKCSKIILVHNHPVATIKPSDADIAFTNKIKAAAAVVEIKILDHIIITEKAYYSFSDMEMI